MKESLGGPECVIHTGNLFGFLAVSLRCRGFTGVPKTPLREIRQVLELTRLDLSRFGVPKTSVFGTLPTALRRTAKQLGVGVGTLYRVASQRSKIREKVFGAG
jgi:hypothetical protein